MKNDDFKYAFQRFENKNSKHWINEEVTAFEIESTRRVPFIPSNRFDAGICIYSGDIPTFEKKE